VTTAGDTATSTRGRVLPTRLPRPWPRLEADRLERNISPVYERNWTALDGSFSPQIRCSNPRERARYVPVGAANHRQSRLLADKNQRRSPGLMQVTARALEAFPSWSCGFDSRRPLPLSSSPNRRCKGCGVILIGREIGGSRLRVSRAGIRSSGTARARGGD
jgi:hypothetical protein